MTMQAMPSHDDDWWWWRRHYTWSVFGKWLKTTHIWRVYLSWIFLRSTCSIYLGYRNLLVKKHLRSFWKQMNSALTQPHENKWWLKQRHSNLLKFSLLKSVDVRQCFTAQEIHSWVESTRELVVECTESFVVHLWICRELQDVTSVFQAFVCYLLPDFWTWCSIKCIKVEIHTRKGVVQPWIFQGLS